MLLYLLRHADALDAPDDDARPLSPKGRQQIDALAKFLAKSDAFAPAEIWHSPLVRARDTASQLRSALRLRAKLVETAGLRPEDDPGTLPTCLVRAPSPLAVVGHEPHLSAFASLLLTGKTSPPVVVFHKCALLALEGANHRWAVHWQISPQLLA